MSDLAKIDQAGRLKLPTSVMGRHRLSRGSLLRIVEDGARIVLEPIDTGSPVVDKNGLLIITAKADGAIPDHRTGLEEREHRWIDPE